VKHFFIPAVRRKKLHTHQCCGSEKAGFGSGKIIPDPGSSGFEMNLKQNNSEKLIKFDDFSTKCSI
jgi:hypothetical protein